MRWPWRRSQSQVAELPKADPDAAEKARQAAEAERAQVEKDNAYINWLHDQLNNHSKENNFSKMITDSMRRRAR